MTDIHDIKDAVIDPKGHIPIAQFDRCALLYLPERTYQPYVVAYGYNKDTGEWSQGSYYGDLGYAYDEANPEIIEEASVRWCVEDIRAKLEEFEIEATDHNIAEVLAGDTGMRPIAKYMKENMIQSGFEDLESRISFLKDEKRFEVKNPEAERETLGAKAHRLSDFAQESHDSAVSLAAAARDCRESANELSKHESR